MKTLLSWWNFRANASGTTSSALDAEQVTNALRRDDLWQTTAIVLVKQGETAIDLLIPSLAHEAGYVRVHAMEILAAIGGHKARSLIESLLSDKDNEVRKNALKFLGQLGWVPRTVRDRVLRAVAISDYKAIEAEGKSAIGPSLDLLEELRDIFSRDFIIFRALEGIMGEQEISEFAEGLKDDNRDKRIASINRLREAIQLDATPTDPEITDPSVDSAPVRLQHPSLIRTLCDHYHSVTSVAFHPSGDRILVGTEDGNIWLFDTESGRELNAFTGLAVEKSSYSPGTGQAKRTIPEEIGEVCFSPDGKLAAFALGGEASDNDLRVWDVDGWVETARFHGHAAKLNFAAFSPDGSKILSGDKHGSVILWDVPSKSLICRLADDSGPKQASAPPAASTGAFISGGSHALVGMTGDRDHLRLWDLAQMKEVQRLGHGSGSVFALAIASDGSIVATCGGGSSDVHLWETRQWKLISSFRGHTTPMINDVAFINDSRLAVSVGLDTARVWSVDSGEEVYNFSDRLKNLSCVAVSPDGNRLLFGSAYGKATLWQIAP